MTVRWRMDVLSTGFRSEGCAFVDVDGDGEPELVAGSAWWNLDTLDENVFRSVRRTWLPEWGGGPDRVDPHRHLRRGGGPPRYMAATYDWALPSGIGRPSRLVSVGMHTDPVRVHEWDAERLGWRSAPVIRDGIYESAVLGPIGTAGELGLVTVPRKPDVAWYEPDADPTRPWHEHLIGRRGGGWHGLGLGVLREGEPPVVLTPTGLYIPGDDIRALWHWRDIVQITGSGRSSPGLGDVCILHIHRMPTGSRVVVGASPHGRGVWRWDLDDQNHTRVVFRRTTLDASTTQTHGVAILAARADEPVDAWVVTGKRWQAHGPWDDEDPSGTPVLKRIGIFTDPTRPPMVETIDIDSGVGLQLGVRRRRDGAMQIGVSNKRGVRLFTERMEATP